MHKKCIFSLHDLLENTDYSIRLMAVTCEGKGARTRWITVTTGGIHRPESGDDWEEQDTKIGNYSIIFIILMIGGKFKLQSLVIGKQKLF